MPDTTHPDHKTPRGRLSLSGIIIMAFLCVAGLASCTNAINNMRGEHQATSTLAQDSYAAADMMIQQAGAALNTSHLIEVAPLTDLDYPTEITNFGHLAAGQIASRLVQLGYKVILSPLDTASLQSNITNAPAASRLITGRYARAGHNIIVNLRLVDHKTGQILAAYDFTVDYTKSIKELSQTQAEKLDTAQNSFTIPSPF